MVTFKGYVYRITNSKDGMLYIGQTTRTIEKRFKEHVYNANNDNDSKLSKAIRLDKKENFEVVELEQIEGYTLKQLRFLLLQAEKFYIEHFESTKWDKGYNTLLDGFLKPNYYDSTISI
jgi:group I intron endonuclease